MAIKHAIWDLTLEFKILRASLDKELNFTDVVSNSLSVSEPSTPKNVANLSRGEILSMIIIGDNSSEIIVLFDIQVAKLVA